MVDNHGGQWQVHLNSLDKPFSTPAIFYTQRKTEHILVVRNMKTCIYYNTFYWHFSYVRWIGFFSLVSFIYDVLWLTVTQKNQTTRSHLSASSTMCVVTSHVNLRRLFLLCKNNISTSLDWKNGLLSYCIEWFLYWMYRNLHFKTGWYAYNSMLLFWWFAPVYANIFKPMSCLTCIGMILNFYLYWNYF